MKRWMLLVMVILLLLGASLWLIGQLEIDKCLDSGGRWSYEAKTCENQSGEKR